MPEKQLEQFQVDILGPKPEEVSFAELAEFVRSLERAVIAAVGDASTEEPVRLRLVGVHEGSDRLTLAVPKNALPNVALLASTIGSQEFSQLPRAAHHALNDMWRVAKRNSWGFRFVADKRRSIVAAEVDAKTGIPPPPSDEIKGATTILARCMRSGGSVTPRVELRLPNRQALLNVDVDEALAKKLGARLYDDVVLSGEATWDSTTWEIVAFKVTAISDYEAVPIDVSFSQLAAAAGDAWDGVDAEQFVREQREEPES